MSWDSTPSEMAHQAMANATPAATDQSCVDAKRKRKATHQSVVNTILTSGRRAH